MRPRVLFFFWSASSAAPGRFLPLFYDSHGLSPSQVGALLGLTTVISFLSAPYFANLADKRKYRQTVLAALQLGSTLLFLSQIPLHPSLNIVAPTNLFPCLLAVSLLFGALNAPIEAIVRAIAISYLRARHGKDGHFLFGVERLWGALGWAFGSVLVGLLADIPSMRLLFIYITHFMFSTIFISIAIKSANEEATLARTLGQDERETRTRGALNDFLAAIRPVIFETGLVTTFFFNFVFWLGFGIAVVEYLLFLYLVNDLNVSYTICGLSIVIAVLTEVPLYALAPRMLLRMSPAGVLLIATFAYVTRVVGYATIHVVWAVLILELLHGVTFATADAACVAFIAQRDVNGAEASAQSLYSAMRAIGMATGSIVGGIILQRFGATVLYLLAGAVVFSAALMFWLSYLCQNDARTIATGHIDEYKPLKSRVTTMNA